MQTLQRFLFLSVGHLLETLLTAVPTATLTDNADAREQTGAVTGQHHPAGQVTALTCPRAINFMTSTATHRSLLCSLLAFSNA